MLVHPQFDPVAIHIGPLAVRWYGLMYLVGFILFVVLGKHRAMELVLTGDMITAAEAERFGLVNRVFPVELFLEEAKNLGRKIAAKPVLSVRAAKEAVLKSANTALDEGLEFERKSFYLLFASEDKSEGMKAFLEKRKPEYKGR